MDKMDLLKSLNEIDEKYREDAAPGTRAGLGRLLPALAVAAVLLAAGLLLWKSSLSGQNDRDPQPDKAAPGTEAPVQAAALPLPGKTETGAPEDPDVLFASEQVTVRRITAKPKNLTESEACLRAMTDRELFTEAAVVVRARLTDVTNVVIESSAAARPQYACILTAEIVRVMAGQLKTDGPVRIFVNRYLNTSLEDLDASLRSAAIGAEGILLLYEAPSGGYVGALADLTVGDNERFAIWEGADGLICSGGAFTSFSRSWTLDQAEARGNELLQAGPQVPEDFSYTVNIQYRGESEKYDSVIFYDSETRRFLGLDLGGGRLLQTASFAPDEAAEQVLFRCLWELKDLPARTETAPGAQGEEYRICLRFTADGRQYELLCRGAEQEASDESRLLYGARDELTALLTEYSRHTAAPRETIGAYSRALWEELTGIGW